MLCNVILTADLATQFGEYHQYDIDSTAEVFKALSANFPGFRPYQFQSQELGIDYQVYRDESAEDFTLMVVPIAGGESGVARIIAGIAVLGIGLFAPFSIGLLGAGVISSTSIGLGLLVGGLSEVITPSKDRSKNSTSTSFGTVSSGREGSIIPASYGQVFIVGQVISADSEVLSS
jgi:predicted phage tail protein